MQGPDQVPSCYPVLMAVSVTAAVQRAGWGGLESPYPVGMWFVEVGILVSGDGSGGNHDLFILFNPAGGALDSKLYNLEQMNATNFIAAAASLQLQVAAQGMGLLAPTLQDSLAQTWVVNTRVPEVTDLAATAFSDILQRATFLGRQVDTSSASQIRIRTVNVNAQTLVVNALGYIWDSKAMSLPGGPRRPPDPLWA